VTQKKNKLDGNLGGDEENDLPVSFSEEIRGILTL
jgi:hypothetical protein